MLVGTHGCMLHGHVWCHGASHAAALARPPAHVACMAAICRIMNVRKPAARVAVACRARVGASWHECVSINPARLAMHRRACRSGVG